jgi:hypothetical protein
MVVALLIGFELLALLFFGVFARSDATSSLIGSYGSLFNNCSMLLLAFTLMYAPFRKFSLFALGSLLLAVVVTVQTYFLFATFWDSCFNGFSTTFTIDLTLITRSLHASLMVLLTALDFLGLFCYWQIYLILAPLLTIGASLCGAILIHGLKVFDGGSGLLVFLYSGVCSLIIWAILVRGKENLDRVTARESYHGQVLGIWGVVLAFINWPKFNAAGAAVSLINVDSTAIVVGDLQNSALANTLFSLSAGLLLAFLLAEKQTENKMRYSAFVDCVINVPLWLARAASRWLPSRTCATTRPQPSWPPSLPLGSPSCSTGSTSSTRRRGRLGSRSS